MHRFSRLPAMLIAAAALVQGAFAQISYTAQTRNLSVGSFGNPFDAAEATGFGPFFRSLTMPLSGTNATLNSTLQPNAIIAWGTALVRFGSEFADTRHDLVFTVSEPTIFNAPVNVLGSGSVVLDGPGGHWASVNGQFANWSGLLLPGQYQLSASATSTGIDSVSNINLQTQAASVFTYQGSLSQGGVPADGPHSLRFTLHSSSAGGAQLGAAMVVHDVPVTQGLFTAQIAFEKQHMNTTADRWIEISVIAEDGSETILSPRQHLDRAPVAQIAAAADQATVAQSTWTGISGVPSNVANAFSPWQHYYGDPNNIFFPSGNVSIGDTTPVAPLTIRGTGPNNDWLALNTGVNTTRWHLNGGTGGGVLNLAETGVADYRLALRAGGKVGVNGLPPTTGAAQFTVFAADFTNGAHIETRSATSLGLSFHTLASPSLAGMYQDPNGQLRMTSNFIGGPTTWTSLGFNGAWTVQSDRRCKKDITPVTGLLEKALKLEPVSYFYKEQDLSLRPDRSIGLIAQDVETLFPEFVTGRGEQMRAIDYAGLSVVAIGAIRELHEQLAAEQATLKAMRAELDALKSAAAAPANQRAAAN